MSAADSSYFDVKKARKRIDYLNFRIKELSGLRKELKDELDGLNAQIEEMKSAQ